MLRLARYRKQKPRVGGRRLAVAADIPVVVASSRGSESQADLIADLESPGLPSLCTDSEMVDDVGNGPSRAATDGAGDRSCYGPEPGPTHTRPPTRT